jgi:hypothetical protein
MLDLKFEEARILYERAHEFSGLMLPEAQKSKIDQLQNKIMGCCDEDLALREKMAPIAFLVANRDKVLRSLKAIARAGERLAAQRFLEAAAAYKYSSELLNELRNGGESVWSLEADYAEGLSYAAEGSERWREGRCAEARGCFERAAKISENTQRSLVSCRADSPTTHNELASIRACLPLNYQLIRHAKDMLLLFERALQGDSKAGLRSVRDVVTHIDEGLRIAENAPDWAKLKHLASAILEGGKSMAEAYRAYFEGEVARSGCNFEKADDYYTDAKLSFETAADHFCGIGQLALAGQLRLTMDLLVEGGRVICKEIKHLCEKKDAELHQKDAELHCCREAFIEIAARTPTAVQVTNGNHLNNTNEISQEMMWVNRAEEKTRELLAKLSEELKLSPLSEQQHDCVGKLGKLSEDGTHGSSFLNKVEVFVQRAKPVLDGIASISGPAAQILSVLYRTPSGQVH